MNARTRTRKVFGLETLEDRLALSAPASGLESALLNIPAAHGRGGSQVQILQDRDTGFQGIQVRQGGARQRIDRAFANFDRALRSLDQAIDRLVSVGPANPRAPMRVFNRALTGTLRAESQLTRIFATNATGVQEADRVRLQSALVELDRLNHRIGHIIEGENPDHAH